MLFILLSELKQFCFHNVSKLTAWCRYKIRKTILKFVWAMITLIPDCHGRTPADNTVSLATEECLWISWVICAVTSTISNLYFKYYTSKSFFQHSAVRINLDLSLMPLSIVIHLVFRHFMTDAVFTFLTNYKVAMLSLMLVLYSYVFVLFYVCSQFRVLIWVKYLRTSRYFGDV